SNLPLILGALAVAAAAGFFFMKKGKAQGEEKAT
ncbi:LPXTG-motif cell wall anchor domain-containing protein, partial [Nitrosomonas halophila]